MTSCFWIWNALHNQNSNKYSLSGRKVGLECLTHVIWISDNKNNITFCSTSLHSQGRQSELLTSQMGPLKCRSMVTIRGRTLCDISCRFCKRVSTVFWVALRDRWVMWVEDWWGLGMARRWPTDPCLDSVWFPNQWKCYLSILDVCL